MPQPKDKPVRITTSEDVNLLHDFTTSHYGMGILHLLNQTPMDWFSKCQNTVETATYGSEFTAARIATEQLFNLRYTLRMLGVPLVGQHGLLETTRVSSQTPLCPILHFLSDTMLFPTIGSVRPLLLMSCFSSTSIVSRTLQMHSASTLDMQRCGL